MRTALIVFGVLLALYALVILALVVAGRRTDARAVGGFIPDCIVLFKRLMGDPAVPRRRKVLLAVLVAYLAMPIDLIPDFIPVAGQADDALFVGLVLRAIVRGGGPDVIRRHWPGPESSLNVVLRLAGARVS